MNVFFKQGQHTERKKPQLYRVYERNFGRRPNLRDDIDFPLIRRV